MNNVHEDQPVVFQTRWALSYLRGPLTREQISRLMADRKASLTPHVSEGKPPSPTPANNGCRGPCCRRKSPNDLPPGGRTCQRERRCSIVLDC